MCRGKNIEGGCEDGEESSITVEIDQVLVISPHYDLAHRLAREGRGGREQMVRAEQATVLPGVSYYTVPPAYRPKGFTLRSLLSDGSSSALGH
jgi:hypothetical protein